MYIHTHTRAHKTHSHTGTDTDTYRKLSTNTLEFALDNLEFVFNLLTLLEKSTIHGGAECSERLLPPRNSEKSVP